MALGPETSTSTTVELLMNFTIDGQTDSLIGNLFFLKDRIDTFLFYLRAVVRRYKLGCTLVS